MNYEKFDLEKAKAGKPFGRIAGGVLVPAAEWFLFTKVETYYPVRVLFEDGVADGYRLTGDGLVMKPEPIVWYKNIYTEMVGVIDFPTIKDADANPGENRIGKIKITVIGNDFTVEKC